MKKSEKVMEIRYNEEQDQFELWILCHDGEWGMVVGCKCVRREGESPENEPEYLHYTLINEINKAAAMGYRLVK